MTEQELMHFGVPGMKWGHRKSTIRQMSMSDRRQAKKSFKTDMKKAKKDYKEHRREYTEGQSFGKKVGKVALLGATGTHAYNSLRASGNSRAAAAGKVVASRALGGPIGSMVLSRMVSSSYKNTIVYGQKAANKTLSSSITNIDFDNATKTAKNAALKGNKNF